MFTFSLGMVSTVNLALLVLLYRRRRRLRERRVGIHPIIRTRNVHGAYFTMFTQLKKDPQRFARYMRMDMQRFDKLLDLVRPGLEKYSRREPIGPEQRLAVTLRFLATGNSFASVASTFFLGESTVGAVVHETCRAISSLLAPTYLRPPSSEAEWLAIADGFLERWNVPHALGAIDGKHILLKAPPRSGSLYHNYKGTFSTVLMAVADHRYRIVYANWKNYGHNGDAGIFDRSDLKRMILDAQNPLHLPAPQALPDFRSDTLLPYFFLGDQAFLLMENLMKPYPATVQQRDLKVYNYRHSRARRIIESTFGLLCVRWRLLLRPMEMGVEKACDVLYAIMCLHNFLIDEMGEPFAALGMSEDAVRSECTLEQARMRRPNAHRYPEAADDVRDILVGYFSGPDALEWQDQRVFVLPDNQNAQ